MADVTAHAPGSPRFRRRSHEAATLGDREIAATAITLGRIDLDPAPPPPALAQHERALSLQIEGLRAHAYLSERLDDALELAAAGVPADRARVLRAEVVAPLRERRRELLAQLAVAVNGLAAVRLLQASRPR